MSYHVLTYRPLKAYRRPRKWPMVNPLPRPLEKPQLETMDAVTYAAVAYAISGGLYSSSFLSFGNSDNSDSTDSSDSSGSSSSDSGPSSSD